MQYIADESGITLVELLAIIALISVVATLMTTMACQVFAIRLVQEEKIKCQVIANRMYTALNTLSNESLVKAASSGTDASPGIPGSEQVSDEKKLGELGKIDGSWDTNQLVKQLDASNGQLLAYDSPGVNELKFESRKDSREINRYQAPNKAIKIKVHLVKNKDENEVMQHGEKNFRDSFSVQTTAYVIFYKGEVTWPDLIKTANQSLDMTALKSLEDAKIVYAREFELSYRDDAKSAGEVSGNGKW
ncbi:hypothetical protein GYN67_04780 [Lactococcus piscium]|uniref:hypothetical protein n=1 Tax=Pseudolactococcus carnosus TaxID=2749961 RepID=UPI001FBB211A|nr:hypothetical protein [Lactococcus carnosus]MCJ1995994.1 hypothetical protein [Lactococcus carnosus]